MVRFMPLITRTFSKICMASVNSNLSFHDELMHKIGFLDSITSTSIVKKGNCTHQWFIFTVSSKRKRAHRINGA